MDVLKIRSFLKENNTPCCVEEIEKATGYSKDDLLSCLNDDENIGRSELFPGLFVYWEASVIGFAVEKRTINHVGKRVAGNMTSSSTNKRGKSSGQRQELEELKRKKQMIEKYTSEGSKKAEEIGDVTEKWKDAALLALEELRTKMQQLEGKSLTQLCRTWDIDPKLLDIEDEEKEEEEEEERQENDDD